MEFMRTTEEVNHRKWLIKQGRRVFSYLILTIMYVVAVCLIPKDNQAQMILSFSIVFYMMTGLVIPFSISVHYFKQGGPKYLVGYFAAPFCGFWLSFCFATPFIIYEKISKNVDLF